MTFFTCNWHEFISEGLLQKLQVLTGEDIASQQESISARLVSIFKHTGGLPVWKTQLSPAQRDSLAEKLLIDALGHFLVKAGRRPQAQIGHYLHSSDHPAIKREIKTAKIVEVNCADQSALESLPLVGPAKAKDILDERTKGGYFASLEDLAKRVDGIGEGVADSWTHITRFKRPTSGPSIMESNESPLGRALKSVLDEFRFVEDGRRLVSSLDAVASLVAASPHPASVEQRPRFLFDFEAGPTSKAEHVGLLEGRSYYGRLPAMFAGATSSICVAMFHAAFRDEEHPTRRLLDALVEAKGRGVHVRVLLDRDRSTDPYLSTIINSSAKAYLDARGVACKFDAEDVLLHSKFAVIDAKLCVVGSHNWSAGSFFHYDDLSFAVEAKDLAAQFISRFDSLWG